MELTKYDIPGFTSDGQLDFITALANSLPMNSNVIEVGIGLGRSTFAWLDGLNPKSTLNAIDNFRMGYDPIIELKEKNDDNITPEKMKLYDYFFKHGQYASFLYNINRHHNKDIINNIFSIRSDEYIDSRYNNIFNCVYLDGSHDYSMVMKELEYFRNSELICGDDYMSSRHPGVTEAVNNFCEKWNKKLNFNRQHNFFVIGDISGRFKME